MARRHDPDHELRKAVAQIQRDHHVDIIFYCGIIYPMASWKMQHIFRNESRQQNVMLFLSTGGGSADEAYRIARFLQCTYEKGKIYLFVDTYCKSARTLLGLGADEIIMSDRAELGPLDVQVYKKDEIGERTSGLTPTQALSSLQDQAYETFDQHFSRLIAKYGPQMTTKSSTNIATRLTVGCFSRIYQQIDPMKLGEHQRAMMIAKEYGTRIARGNLRPRAIDRLIADYPSHEFVIDRTEARKLFSRVRSPSHSEQKMAECLLPKILAILSKRQPRPPTIELMRGVPAKPEKHTQHEELGDVEKSHAGGVSPKAKPNRQEVDGKGQPKTASRPSNERDGLDPVSPKRPPRPRRSDG
jgi:hypothetical protein